MASGNAAATEISAAAFELARVPFNDFKGQEPDSESQVEECFTLTCGVRFSMFGKTRDAGADATSHDADLAKIASEVKPEAMALAAAIEHEPKAAAPTR